MSELLQQCGASWTDQKLQKLRAYLIAYHNALKKQPLTLYYVDAFALILRGICFLDAPRLSKFLSDA